MLLADSNVWLGAGHFPKHEFHAVVRAWFARQKPPEAVLFCRSTQQSFLRLLGGNYGKGAPRFFG